MNQLIARTKIHLIWVSIVLCSGACTELRLISDYDDYTDGKVTEIQRGVEEIFTGLERGAKWPDCAHEKSKNDYKNIFVDLNILIARNELRPKNEFTTEQLRLLKDSMVNLETLHEDASAGNTCLSVDEIALLRTGFSTSFGAIMRLELAKKRNMTKGQ